MQDAAEQITRKYFHKDHLGSIVAVTDSSGQTLAEYAYDAWGKRRNAQTWGAGSIGPFETDRGFTGHEMLDNVELVHMNGRIYDPVISLFLSADPFIQSPYNLQSYNRYAYVVNNPLTFNDPSGYFIGMIFSFLGAIWGGVTAAIVAIGGALVANPALAGMILGGISGGMNGGIGGAIMGAFMGGVTAGLFAGPQVSILGSSLLSSAVEILAHGVVQGGLAEISGGDFGPAFLAGFAGAALGKFAGPLVKNNSAAGLIAAAVIGGTASELGGGKFANGAITGSFAYLLSSGMDLKKLGRDALSLGGKVKTVLLGSDLSKLNLNPFDFAYGNYVGGNRTNGLDQAQKEFLESQIGGEGNPSPIDALDYGGLRHDQRFTRTKGSMRGAYDLLLIKDAALGIFGIGQGFSAPIVPSIMTITGMGIAAPFHAIGISNWRK